MIRELGAKSTQHDSVGVWGAGHEEKHLSSGTNPLCAWLRRWRSHA
jgi:hypothetical protein